MRKTCDNCHKSKLRCSGRGISGSCPRCEEDKIECVFSLKKKTGPKVINIKQINFIPHQQNFYSLLFKFI